MRGRQPAARQGGEQKGKYENPETLVRKSSMDFFTDPSSRPRIEHQRKITGNRPQRLLQEKKGAQIDAGAAKKKLLRGEEPELEAVETRKTCRCNRRGRPLQ